MVAMKLTTAQRRLLVLKKKKKKRPDPPETSSKDDGEKPKKKKPSKHTWEGSYLCKTFHNPGCVNRHVSYFSKKNNCSHRRQARDRAEGDVVHYFDLEDSSVNIVSEKDYFAKYSSIPWDHEAHHVVANAELRKAVEDAAGGFTGRGSVVLMIRGRLMEEGYNLNDKINMIILPEERAVALQVGLPKHRLSAGVRKHEAYSMLINGEVKSKFLWLKQEVDDHGEKMPDYQSTKKAIEAVSLRYHGLIIAAGLKLKLYKGKNDALDLIFGGN
jgi:hypothetical protein